MSDERHEPDLGPVLPKADLGPVLPNPQPPTEKGRTTAVPAPVDGSRSTAPRAEPVADSAAISVGVRPVEPSPDAAALAEHPLAGERPSIGRRTLRAGMWFCIAVLIGVAGTLTVQSHTREVGAMVSAWVPFLKRPAAPPAEPPAAVAASDQTSPAATGSVPTQAAAAPPPAPVAQPVAQVVPPPVVAAPSPETMQQLEAIAHDLAELRHSVEELSAKQEQMAKGIASLHAIEQPVRRKPPPPRTAAVPPRRNDAYVPPPLPRNEAVPPAARPAPVPQASSSTDEEPPPRRPPAPVH